MGWDGNRVGRIGCVQGVGKGLTSLVLWYLMRSSCQVFWYSHQEKQDGEREKDRKSAFLPDVRAAVVYATATCRVCPTATRVAVGGETCKNCRKGGEEKARPTIIAPEALGSASRSTLLL